MHRSMRWICAAMLLWPAGTAIWTPAIANGTNQASFGLAAPPLA